MTHESGMEQSFKLQPMAQAVVIHKMIHDTGVNPTHIYCQFTGAPMGSLNHDEWSLIWATLDDGLDCDSIMDELYARTIISMRPSPAWNYIRVSTLNQLRKADPVRMCAYLLSRFYEPHDRTYARAKRSFEDRIQDGINRIICFQRLAEDSMLQAKLDESIEHQENQAQQFMTLLFLIDSQFDLSKAPIPEGFPTSPHDLDVRLLTYYVDLLQDYYDSLVRQKELLERKAKLGGSWMAEGGNRMTFDPARKLFFETKPKTEATRKREESELAVKSIAHALKLLMDGPDSDPNPVIQAPIKVGGGFKLRIGTQS